LSQYTRLTDGQTDEQNCDSNTVRCYMQSENEDVQKRKMRDHTAGVKMRGKLRTWKCRNWGTIKNIRVLLSIQIMIWAMTIV